MRRAVAVLAAAAILAVVGCDGDSPTPAPSPPVELRWEEVSVPMPPGPPGRVMLRDAASCDGRWYLTGAVNTGGYETRPAVWSSPDARTWTPVALRPLTYYGERHVMFSAACRGDRLAVLGSKVGGAHGNPRVSSWAQRPDGSMIEVKASFELYGGPLAVNVSRLAGGSDGFMIAGNRMSGAAAWTSPDSAEFTIHEAVPELASDDRGETWAFEAARTRDGWAMVGGLIPAGRIDRDPLAWRSTDGIAWTREPVPGDPTAYDELQRVVIVDDGPLAVGLRGNGFGAWTRTGGTWAAAGAFGRYAGDKPPIVSSLTVAPGGVVACVSDGAAFALWSSADRGGSWRAVGAPAPMPAGTDRAAVARSDGRQVLLLADDGTQARLWLTDRPVTAG